MRFFLLWPLLFGGMCALIALLKRRNAVVWFFLGIIFHILAFGILLFLPALSHRPEEIGKTTGEIRCPYCQGLIRLDTYRCPHCGKDVRPIDV